MDSPRPATVTPAPSRRTSGAPIAAPEVYAPMLDAAKAGSFAYPPINLSASQTLNAALQGFAEAWSDGIVQIFTGPGVRVGPDGQGQGRRRGRARDVRPRGGEGLPGDRGDAHRPVPKEQPGQLRARDRRTGSPPHRADVRQRARGPQTVVQSFSLMSWLTPSSSPPTTPTSISRMMPAAAHVASSSSAIERFSSSSTAEPSHLCDWNSDGVLKIDGEVGNRKVYDPRAWGKLAEAGIAARIVEACEHLRSTGRSLTG